MMEFTDWVVSGQDKKVDVGLMFEHIIDVYMLLHSDKMKWWPWVMQVMEKAAHRPQAYNTRYRVVKEAVKGLFHHKAAPASCYAQLLDQAFLTSQTHQYDDFMPFVLTLTKFKTPQEAWSAMDAVVWANESFAVHQPYLSARVGALTESWLSDPDHHHQALLSLKTLFAHHITQKGVVSETVEKIIQSDYDQTDLWDVLRENQMQWNTYLDQRMTRALYVTGTEDKAHRARQAWMEYIPAHFDISESVQVTWAKACLLKNLKDAYAALVLQNPSLLKVQASSEDTISEERELEAKVCAIKDESFGQLPWEEQQKIGPELVSVHPLLLDLPHVQKWHLTSTVSSVSFSSTHPAKIQRKI